MKSILKLKAQNLSEINFNQLQQQMHQHPLVLIRGLDPLARADFLNLAQQLGQLLEWDFGPVMELEVQTNAKNYLFSHEEVPLHWDGAFYQEPRWLIFNCITPPAANAGGETFFADTHLLWQQTDAATRKAWEKIQLSYQTETIAHYGGKIHLPMLQSHPATNKPIVRYAEPVTTELNPVHLEVHNTDDQAAFIADMRQRLYNPDITYTHHWQAGDLLFADNFQLLHGRTAFEFASPRHLRRIQLLRPHCS